MLGPLFQRVLPIGPKFVAADHASVQKACPARGLSAAVSLRFSIRTFASGLTTRPDPFSVPFHSCCFRISIFLELMAFSSSAGACWVCVFPPLSLLFRLMEKRCNHPVSWLS